MSNFTKVAEFMRTGGQEVKTIPTLIDYHTASLRTDLIVEELNELSSAIYDGDIVEIADALTDLLYVIYGTGHSFGIDLDACFDEVHSSNMSKFENGLALKREDGKILKGKYYRPPNLKQVLLKQEILSIAKELYEEEQAYRQPSLF